MFPDCGKYVKTSEGKRFFRKNFKRKEKGHGEKSQRLCKACTFEEELIYVQKGNMSRMLKE